jgi:hypothetical protein
MDRIDKPLSELIASRKQEKVPPKNLAKSNLERPNKPREKNLAKSYLERQNKPRGGKAPRNSGVLRETRRELVQPYDSRPKNRIIERLGGAVSSQDRHQGAKVKISNLNPDITEVDITDLCETIGEVVKVRRFKGSGAAECIFNRRADALAAVKRFDSLTFDGVMMPALHFCTYAQ